MGLELSSFITNDTTNKWLDSELIDTSTTTTISASLLFESADILKTPATAADEVTEPFVSGNHARIYAKNNNLYVEDLNSTNGVYVNNERIEEKYKLIADDEVKIGSAIFKVLKSGK